MTILLSTVRVSEKMVLKCLAYSTGQGVVYCFGLSYLWARLQLLHRSSFNLGKP